MQIENDYLLEEEYEKDIKNSIENFWNTLNQQEKLYAFCAVISKLTDAELNEKKSYRGVLYEKFGFGPESYHIAQISGFIQLHNSIYSKSDITNIINTYLKENNLDNLELK